MTIDPAPDTDARPASQGQPREESDRESEATIVAPVVTGDGEAERSSSPLATPAGSGATTVAARPARGRRATRIKARQVQRVVTRIDPWSMLKVSLLFALSLWLIVVVAGVLLWRVAVSTGTIGNFENFLAQILAEDSFTIDGGQIFQGSLVAGLVFFTTGAVFAVVTSVLFNLIAGVIGGVRFTVVELETARPADQSPDGD